jgi:prephenate dehydrogenase
VAALDRRLPAGVAFVGAHPLAGSEQRGLEAARPQLFEGASCILTPTARTSPAALRRVADLWRPLVDRVYTMSPRRHDELLAGLSHLPHLLAYCLADTVDTGALSRAPQSFLDMTRIARSDPALWDDIFLSNREALLAAIRRFDGRWRRFRDALARGELSCLRRLLVRAHARRHACEGA